jgi:Zn-dependent protease with chaperone function
VRRVVLLFVLLTAVGGAGCAAATGVPARADERLAPGACWVDRNGGITGDAAMETRAAAALSRVAAGRCGALTVRVLASETIAAYAWPDGSVFVTAALVARLDDDELAAAIAHELGHLLNDSHLRWPAGRAHALSGAPAPRRRAENVETRADDTGVALLIDAGVEPAAMVRMLEKVAASARLPQPAARALAGRIERLTDP